MPIKKIFIASMVFSLVLSTIPWQAMAAQEELSPLSLPVPTKLENNTPIVLEPSPEPVDLGPNQSETKESDDESISDISAPVDQQPEELLAEPDNLVLDEPVDVPYIDRDEKKPASEQLNVDIDSNTGALIYSYPIAVAPGRNGLQPDLSLTYNNQNSDNFNQFGMGWSLSIPYIERDGKRGVNNLYALNYFSSSLSGDLRPIDLTDGTHGLYGARVENGGFFKYEFSSSTDAWIVTDKQGVIYTFGPANSSRQYDPSDSSKIYKWMLQEVRDTNDNYIKYEYYQDGNEIYPYKIKYTGHDTTDGIFEVEFLREARSDEMQSFKTGFEVNTDYRIYEIQAKVNGSWVRKYELDYINGDNGSQSLLNTITQSGNDGVNTITLPIDDFDYADPNPGWTEDSNFPAPYFYSPWFDTGNNYFYDANGDALDDRIWLKNEYPEIGSPYIHLSTWLSDAYGWDHVEEWDFPTSTENNLNLSATRFVDVNGDALTDIIISDYSRGVKDIYINNGTDWELDNSYNFPIYFNVNDAGNHLIDAGVRLVDLNGDGLVDVVSAIRHSGSLNTAAWLNNGHGWSQTYDFQPPIEFAPEYYDLTGYQDIGVRFADINGDGLVDILRSIAVLGQDQHREVYINNGHGWDLDGSYYIPVLFRYSGGNFSILSELVDLNQDGLTDIVNITSSVSPLEKEVYINNGHGWNLSTSHQLPDIDNVHIFDGNFAMVDVNGDGFMDIIQNRDAEDYYGDDVKKVFINNGKKELLETINTGQGSSIDMSYKASNSYRDAQNNLLNPNLPYKLDTVEQIEITDNYNENIVTNYLYTDGDLYYDTAYEKRNAGFGEVTKINGDQKTLTYFHQGNDSNYSQGEYQDTYYKIGKPYRSEVYDNNADQLLKQNIIKWEENLNEPPESQAKSSLIDANIVSLWAMNGQAATTEKQDNIVGGPDLSERNNPTSVMGDDFDPDGAYNFSSASQQYVKIGDNDILDLDYTFTIDALIKFNSVVPIDTTRVLLSKDHDTLSSKFQYMVSYRDDTAGVDDRGVFIRMTTGTGLWSWEPSVGEWYYLSVIHDRNAGTVEVYVDGVSLGVKSGFAANDYEGDFTIGGYLHPGGVTNFWDGAVDEVRLSDKIRTPEEIANYSHIISNERKFVYDTQRSSTDLTDTTKSTASQKNYDLTNGNLETELSLGEVNINLGTGQITNQLTGDEKNTNYFYAENEVKHILSAPKTKVISDTVDTKQQDLYYDNMAYGYVDKTNLTKEDYIEDNVEINRSFNSFGLVDEQTDPKGLSTTIVYDDYDLYPKSTEDPLGYITLTEYDHINGKISSSTDPNGLVTNNTYDALGRLKEVEISSPNNPSQLITKQEINYYDDVLPVLSGGIEFELDSDTVALWRMNGLAASAAKKDNAQGNSQYDLTENNSPGSGDGFMSIVNGSYDLNGTDQYLSFANSQGGNLYGTESTIEAWIYLDQLTGQRQIIYEDWDVAPSYLLSFYVNSDGRLRAERNYASTNSEAIGSTVLPTGQWLYVVAVFKENEPTKVYLNGQLDGTAPNSASSPNMSSSNGVQIGTWQYNGGLYYYFDGKIDQIRVSDVARSGTEFLSYYNQANGLYTPRYKETKDYFTVSNYTTSREYYDGLDRVIQKKIQTDNASEWSTVDITYDEQGRVVRQSLPYITDSVSYSVPDLNKPANTYTYDALDRITTEVSPVGTSTYHYDGFTTIITDANGHRKDLTKDAYGNLVEVVEENEYTSIVDFQFEVNADTVALWHMNGSLNSAAKKDNAEDTIYYDLTENNTGSAEGFNGGDDGSYDFEKDNGAYLSVPDYSELDLDTDFTIEAWVKFESAAPDDQLMTIVSKDGGDLNRQYTFGYRNDAGGLGYSGLYVAMSSDGSKSVINGSALWAWEPSLDEWHYVAVAYNKLDGSVEVFADGESLGLRYNFPNSIYDDDNIFRIGANGTGGYWDGLIDEVRISNTAHDLEDIAGYYNGFNKVVTEVNGNFYTTTYEYTLTNKLEKITDSQGNIRNFHYDALDNLDWQDMVHLSSVLNPKKIQYTHDKNGNVLTETSFKGDAISYVYDDLSRVLYEKLSGVNQISYTYDQGQYAKGQLTYADYGGNNHKAYTYDIFGRLAYSTTTIENENFTMGFEYNLNGDPETITYPNGWQVIYNYNSVGQVDQVQLDRGQGAVTLVDNIEYNANGQMTHMERANGIDSDYVYDPDENYRLTDMETTDGVDMLQDLSYSYDDVGNITRIDDNSDTGLAKVVYYDYDDLNRLASSTVNYLTHSADNYSRQYQYDEVGNMTYNSELGTMNYANDNPHQLSGYGTRTFVYDDAGNMTRNGGITKFAWDWRNRLKNTYDIASENNTYYKYDHNNQRFLKYTEELVFIPPDPEDPPIRELGLMVPMASGGTYELRRVKEDKYVDNYFEKDIADHTRTHINLNNIKIATAKDASDPYFILSDHLNSSTIITDTSGNLAEISDYEPFGVTGYSDISQDVGDDYTFTGHEYDEESSLQYSGARYLDNQVGRFISIDPALIYKPKDFIKDPQQLNTYAYARNNPIVNIDPLGLETVVYIEKGKISDGPDSAVGHSFIQINRDGKSTIYSWGDGGGNVITYDGLSRSEDLKIMNSKSFFDTEGKDSDQYTRYTFDTSANQENNIVDFYNQLAADNSDLAQNDQATSFNPLLYNCTDVTIDAMKAGDIVSNDFSATRWYALGASTPGALSSRLNEKYTHQDDNVNWFSKLMHRSRETDMNQIMRVYSSDIYKTNN